LDLRIYCLSAFSWLLEVDFSMAFSARLSLKTQSTKIFAPDNLLVFNFTKAVFPSIPTFPRKKASKRKCLAVGFFSFFQDLSFI